MRTTRLASALAAAVALAAPAAPGAGLPGAYGHATSGSLEVVSDVLLGRRSAEMMGVWLDDTLACSATRTLRVSVEVFYSSPSGGTKRKRLAKTGAVANCAEGGPNFGFTFKAKKRGFACASGKWKPGSYSFLTETEDTASGLTASAVLLWENETSC